MARISFPYEGFGDAVIPDGNLLAVPAPRTEALSLGRDPALYGPAAVQGFQHHAGLRWLLLFGQFCGEV